MLRRKEDGIEYAYLHNLSNAERDQLSSGMKKCEKGRNMLDAMKQAAVYAKAFEGVFRVEYDDYLRWMGMGE